MRSSKAIHIVGSHAEGEVGDVIVGGVFRHVNLLVPPKDPRAQVGWISIHAQLRFARLSIVQVCLQSISATG